MVLQFELRRSRRDVLGKHRSISVFPRPFTLLLQYYAFRALKFRIPRWISMMITLLQLSQMIIGFWINLKAWDYKANGQVCQVTNENLKVSADDVRHLFPIVCTFLSRLVHLQNRHRVAQHRTSPSPRKPTRSSTNVFGSLRCFLLFVCLFRSVVVVFVRSEEEPNDNAMDSQSVCQSCVDYRSCVRTMPN